MGAVARFALLLVLVMPVVVSMPGCTQALSPAAGGTRKDVPSSAAAGAPKDVPVQTETSEVAIKPIKLADYAATIKQHQGKVLLVDFWFKNCIPCEQALPHLVAMQTKHAAAGLVVLTVDCEDPKGPNRPRAIQFLKEKRIALTNYVLDDDQDVDAWYKQLDLAVFPTTLLYDRDGKLVKKFEGENVEKIAEAVVKALQGHPG